jgi:hypothetical protein
VRGVEVIECIEVAAPALEQERVCVVHIQLQYWLQLLVVVYEVLRDIFISMVAEQFIGVGKSLHIKFLAALYRVLLRGADIGDFIFVQSVAHYFLVEEAVPIALYIPDIFESLV